MHHIEDKGAFGAVPYQGGDERACYSGAFADLCIGRDLIGDIEDPPDDQIGQKIVEMDEAGKLRLVKVGLDKG